MNTGTIIGIAVGAVVVLLLIALVARAASRRRDERRREQAGELRQEARSRSIQAESARASADEQAAQAKRAQAEAEERAAQARQGHAAAERRAVEAEHLTESARDQHAQARAIDPNASDSGQDEALAMINAPTDRFHRNGQLSEVHGDSCYRSRMVVRHRGCRDQLRWLRLKPTYSRACGRGASARRSPSSWPVLRAALVSQRSPGTRWRTLARPSATLVTAFATERKQTPDMS